MLTGESVRSPRAQGLRTRRSNARHAGPGDRPLVKPPQRPWNYEMLPHQGATRTLALTAVSAVKPGRRAAGTGGGSRETAGVGAGQGEGRSSPSLRHGRRLSMDDFWKRTIDVTLVVLLLVLLLPLLAVVSLLIAATSPGPVIFRQARPGQFGRSFVLYKFRTMVEEAEALLEHDQQLKNEFAKQWKLSNDPRITPIGQWLRKTSIDELPQLINVLCGEMSLVGPRPRLSDELKDSYGELANVLLTVKPGMTGLWQVEGRSSSSYEERAALDLEYVRRRSAWFDLVLLFRTIPAVLFMRGAS